MIRIVLVTEANPNDDLDSGIRATQIAVLCNIGLFLVMLTLAWWGF